MKKINSLTESSFLQNNEAIKKKISAFDGIATEPIRIYGGTVRTYFTLGYMYLSLLVQNSEKRNGCFAFAACRFASAERSVDAICLSLDCACSFR